jgi:hypothetical protein
MRQLLEKIEIVFWDLFIAVVSRATWLKPLISAIKNLKLKGKTLLYPAMVFSWGCFGLVTGLLLGTIGVVR